MDGDQRVRFCQQCKLNVYNLSEMTKKDAEDLILEKEGKLCVRFYKRLDGTVLTRDCPLGRLARYTTNSYYIVVTWLLMICISIAGLTTSSRGLQILFEKAMAHVVKELNSQVSNGGVSAGYIDHSK